MTMSKMYIGIDNGVTGSIGIVNTDGTHAFIPMPVFKDREYTKEVQYLHRIDVVTLLKNLPKDGFILLERPMVNPKTFVSSKSALRAFEATLIVIEALGYKRGESFDFIDSKEWQKEFFASSISGHDQLKEASLKVGLELFPFNGKFIKQHKDADGLLIAEYARRKYGK
jgi:hypothetical protein